MMLKEVLLLVLVGWMVMPAHPWKPPEHGYRNDDTSDILDRPSPQNTQMNIRDHRNYIHHRYGYNNPTGPEIFRQLRHNTGKEQPKKSAWEKRKEYDKELKRKSGKANPMKSAWETCKELSKKSAKAENSKMTATSENRSKPSPKVAKRQIRTHGNYTLHRQSHGDPSGHGIFRRQIRNRATKGNSHTEVLPDTISFDDFKSKFNKKYDNGTVEMKRKTIFEKNMKEIADHNKLYYSGKSSYRKGVSWITDLTYDEVIRKRTCSKDPTIPVNDDSEYKEKRQNDDETEYVPKYINQELPIEVSYTKCGAFNSIRNQLKTSGCWAFSAISAIESNIFLKTRGKDRPDLSEQYIVDCCKEKCCGCSDTSDTHVQAGYSNEAIKFVKKNGIVLSADYDYYTGKKGNCDTDATQTPYKVKDILRVQQNKEDELKNALVHEGPIAISIYSSSKDFSEYQDGVFPEMCDKHGTTDHSILLVGYGTDYNTDTNGVDYWLIRNSWGEISHKGYVKIKRNGTNRCNDNISAYIPKM